MFFLFSEYTAAWAVENGLYAPIEDEVKAGVERAIRFFKKRYIKLRLRSKGAGGKRKRIFTRIRVDMLSGLFK